MFAKCRKSYFFSRFLRLFGVDFGKGCDELIQYLSVSNDLHPEVRYDIMHIENF